MGILFGLVLVTLIELYGFIGIRNVASSNATMRKITIGVYLAITVLLWLSFITYRTWGYQHLLRDFKSTFTTLFIAFTVAKLVVALFLFSEDVTRFTRWAFNKATADGASQTSKISRSDFLGKVAIMAATVPLGTFIYGALRNAYNYQFRAVPLRFTNLPAAFDGFKIVQLSDIHSGSFSRTEPIQKVIEKINALDADLILFTGDIVNNVADEMLPYKQVFNKLRAKHGVMSVTGNHDYGDYAPWNSVEEKKDNFRRLIQTHKDMGWDILLNESRVIEKEGEKIAVLGVENWGAKMHFPKYGKMELAHAGTQHIPFKILMSHDPSHWDAEVRPLYPDVDLTLSGHTHGFQFGIENKYIKWSPVQFAYRQWAGLYQESKQFLYVNRGFGFLGYPGRVGILPEITVIELKKV